MKVLRADGTKVLEGYMDELHPLKHGGVSIDVRTFAKNTLYKVVLGVTDLDFLAIVMATEKKELDMSQAHINLVSYVLNHGGRISVCDPDWKESEDERVSKGGIESLPWLIAEIESWDGGQDFYVIEPEHDLDSPGTGKLWWVGMAMGYGNEPHETVYDFVQSPLLKEWFEIFFKEYCND
jgi:hypothetical protein